MSGEHLWSEWIGKLLGDREYVFRRNDEHGAVISEWPSDELDWKAKVVCEGCNNGWMSRLENDHAKPTLAGIIAGRPVSLLPRGIVSLASFAFKCAVVCDHMNAKRAPFFSPAVREAFRHSLRIPSGVQMWLSAYQEPGRRDGKLNSYYLNIRSGRNKGFEFNIFTYGLSPFVFQVASCRWTKPAPRRQAIPSLAQHEVWNGSAMQFWPPTNTPMEWPPSQYFDRAAIDQFINRWVNLRDGMPLPMRRP